MRPVQKEITAQNADEGIFELQPCTRDGLIFNISEAGKTLTGGTLELAPEAYITLNSSCSDIMLEDLVVKGTFIPCVLAFPLTCVSSAPVEQSVKICCTGKGAGNCKGNTFQKRATYRPVPHLD